MRKISIDLAERSYDIVIANTILGPDANILNHIKGAQVLIITNEVVAPLYLDSLKSGLKGKQIEEIILADGEVTKTLATAELIFEKMLQIPLDRSATVIALGGGVVGDMAGFTASCYQRGIPFIQIPTTLLAQVDSSVGGKTAVNHPLGKNMIGAFYQPQYVMADIGVLSTLEPRQFSSGMAEVIKYGLINDISFFDWLEQNMDPVMNQDPDAVAYVVEQSCKNKAKIVELDEREGGIRALLNLGHTFGHAVETATGYGPWLHGEAVSLGMMMAMYMSMQLGWVTSDETDRVARMLIHAGLPVEPSNDFSATQLRSLMQLDKKVAAGKIRLILLRGIGDAFVCDEYSDEALNNTLEHFALA